jgi:hypothetical protein
MLRPRGCPGGDLPAMRFVRSVRPAAKAEVFLKLAAPVKQAQVDWGPDLILGHVLAFEALGGVP